MTIATRLGAAFVVLLLPLSGQAALRCEDVFSAPLGPISDSFVRSTLLEQEASIQSARGLLGPTNELVEATSRLVKQIAQAEAGSRLAAVTRELDQDLKRIARSDVRSRTRLGRVLNFLSRRGARLEEWAARFRKNQATYPMLLAEVKAEVATLRTQANDIRASIPRLAEQSAELEAMVNLLNQELAQRTQRDPVRQVIENETLPSIIHALAETKTIQALASAGLEAIAERLSTDQALLKDAVSLNDEALPAFLLNSGPKIKRLLANESLEFCVHGDLCVGTEVVVDQYHNYYRGRVKGIFANGKVDIEYNLKDRMKMMGLGDRRDYQINYRVHVATADARYSAQGYRVGERVRLNGYDIEAKVAGFFLDGEIALDAPNDMGGLTRVRPDEITSLDRPISAEHARLFEQVSGNERLSRIARFLRSASLPELNIVNSPASELVRRAGELEISTIMMMDAAQSARTLREMGRDQKPRPTELFEEIIDGITDGTDEVHVLIRRTIADRERSRTLLKEVAEHLRVAEFEVERSPHAASLKMMLDAVQIALEQRIRGCDMALEKAGPQKIRSIPAVLKFHESQLKEKLGATLFAEIFPQGAENGPIPSIARKHFDRPEAEPVVVKQDRYRDQAVERELEKFDKKDGLYSFKRDPNPTSRQDIAITREGITFMGVTIGDQVLIAGEIEGRVVGLFPDGRFAILAKDSKGYHHFRPASELTVILTKRDGDSR